MGSRPLNLEDEYMRRSMEFLREHDGIKDTPTRSYYGLVEASNVINKKMSFGIVKVFMPFRDSDYKKHPKEAQYRDEFDFRKPSLSYAYYLNHLDLYVKVLYAMAEDRRRTYLPDFFLIIKAIRQRPHIHRKLLDLTRFKLAVMSYFLVAGQANLAMASAAGLLPKAIPESLARWPILRLLGLAPMYSVDQGAIGELRAVQEGAAPTARFSDLEYNFNLVSHSILAYYYDRPDVAVTDLEIVRMVRCFEARELTGDLMDMLPMVLCRFARGPTSSLPPEDFVELLHEKKAREWKVSDMQIAMRYALAFGRIGKIDRLCKFLHTIADMAPKPIAGIRGNTRNVAKALAKLAELGRSTDNIVMATLEHFGSTSIEASLMPMTYAEYKAKLVEEIANRLCKGDLDEGFAATELLKALSVRLTPFAAMAMVKRLNQTSRNLALGWMARSIYAFDREAQAEAVQWAAQSFRRDSAALASFIQWNCKLSAVATAQFVHLLSRRLWESDTERLRVLTQAFNEISRIGDMRAIGLLLVSAAMGPETPIISPFGAQTPTGRAKAIARLVALIEPKNGDINALVPYLFKAVGSLKARGAERVLWKELLRRGIEPDWRVLQTALGLRLEQQYSGRQAIEIIQEILEHVPISGTVKPATPACNSLAEDGASACEIEAASDSESLAPALVDADLAPEVDGSALYLTLMDGLNRSGHLDAVEKLAMYLLDSGKLTNRTFGALASVWLDSVGFSRESPRDHIQHVWSVLAGYVGEKHAAEQNREHEVYRFNQNHYHSAIEACVRKGDVNAAWFIIQVEMRKCGIKPTLKTFYTLVSPLAQNSKLWPIGKSAVAKFNSHYPDIVKSAVEDNTNTLKVRALLHYTLN
ncbi:hypothetical protein GGI12_000201 [Dipsacomyces acuminosporus]|nr:hypothetical protein GGI12_000201 [Dipsacomyces acuminosporus]